ncbi:MAG: hypothetical protein MI673_04390 [Thiotrichales bacterium]|nr:hypothetical protein [Thiotrichales bacterium]
MDEVDRWIMKSLQQGFPVRDHPFSVYAHNLGVDESSLISHVKTLLEQGHLSSFGPLYNLDKIGCVCSLAAIKVPEEKFEETSQLVNDFEEVTHNFELDHEFNMWFVVITDTQEQLTRIINAIHDITGLEVYNFLREKEYSSGLKFYV